MTPPSTTTYTPEDKSALVALIRAHPDMAPGHLRRRIKGPAPQRRDWMIIPKRRPIVPDASMNQLPVHRRIIALVSAVMDVPQHDIMRPYRNERVVTARQICMWLMRQHCKTASFPAIGRWIKRDHTTVMHGIRKIERNYGCHAYVIETVERLL